MGRRRLRNKARELQRAVRAGDPDALALVGEFYPGAPAAQSFPLSAAQVVTARRYRFGSWARLRRHVTIVTARAWSPAAPPPEEPLADRFLRLACLTYSDDEASDRAMAAQLLADHPELRGVSLPVAAACSDVAQVRRFLAGDGSLAVRPGGPHGWSPLLYQAYARHDPQVSLDVTLQTARLLLEAGADPNDGQLLYNRMFGPRDDHLVLLFEFGLGRDADGRGPWRRLLGDALESPAVMLGNLLWWAVIHDQRARVALLAANGVDVVAAFTELRYQHDPHRTPAEEALVNGHRELAAQLAALGAGPPRLSPADAFVAAAMAGDAEAVRRTDPGVIAAVREARPGLVTWAASQGAPHSVELLVAAGFDVNAYGRSDIPVEGPWHTALHVAAGNGNLALARKLLALGANPHLRDKHHNSAPADWARRFAHQELIDLLAQDV